MLYTLIKRYFCDLQNKVYENRWKYYKTNQYFEGGQKFVVFRINYVPRFTTALQMSLTLIISLIAEFM